MISFDATEVYNAIEKLKNDGPAKKEMLTRIAEKGKQDLKSRAKSSSATGVTSNSITTEVAENTARIYSTLGYSNIALETGRKPGKPPPVNALFRWAVLKGKPKGFAYYVAKKIGKEGTQPKGLVTETINKLDQIIPKELSNYIKKILT